MMKALFAGTIANFFDAAITIEIGIIKGVGMQVYATIAYLFCFYVISVPNSYIFGFVFEMGVEGLQYGLTVGLLALTLLLFGILFKADWKKIASSAQIKLLKEKVEMTNCCLPIDAI